MSEVAVHAPGTPIWVDLASPDLEASKAFYSGLFGWEAHVTPDPAAGGYTMFNLDGKEVAGLGPLTNPQQPPAWTSYMSTVDAKATAQKVRDAGGTVLMEPMEVMGAGSMAIFQDPTGAVFAVWQPGEHKGASVFNVPGALSWNELQTRDVEAAKRFYSSVFGWAAKDSPNYTEWLLGGRSIGGMMPMAGVVPDQVPPHWNVYFTVADCAATVDRVTTLGGSVINPPMEIDQGTFAIVSDPQGAAFTVIQTKA